MHRLNYNHLYYFWIVAQEGSLSKAARRLSLTHSTISAQIHSLEDALGNRLFTRRGTGLVLTSIGSDVYSYASDIFRLCSELVDVAHGLSKSRRSVLKIGIVQSIPSSISFRIIEPAFRSTAEYHIQIIESDLKTLIESLAHSKIHMIISDSPQVKTPEIELHRHLLGKTGIALYGSNESALKYRDGFPGSAAEVPLILPNPSSSIRLMIERWFTDRSIPVTIAAECDNPGITMQAGNCGYGLFPVRLVLQDEVDRIGDVAIVGTLTDLFERCYLITQNRRLTHPIACRIAESARHYFQNS